MTVSTPENQKEARERMTREGLAAVDAGRTVNHEAVQAWADSLGTDGQLPTPHSAG